MNNYSQLFGQNGSIKLRPKAFCTVDVIRLVVSLTHRNITVNSTRPYTHTHTHTHTVARCRSLAPHRRAGGLKNTSNLSKTSAE